MMVVPVGRRRGRKKRGPLPLLVAGVVVAVVLATALVEGAWLMWLPVLLALAVVGRVWFALSR